MISFRMALLLIGLGLIVAVYLWDRLVKRRRRYPGGAKRVTAVRRPELEMGGVDHLDQADEFVQFREPTDDAGHDEGAGPQVGWAVDQWLEEDHHHGQMALGFNAKPKAADSSQLQPAVRSQHIVSLFIKAPPGRPIAGAELLEAMREVGMRYGEMGIFHHFGVGSVNAAAPLFSVANMFEPGSFELATLESIETRGLVVFAYLPGEVDAPVVFELMLNTTQRLTDRFRGELLDDQRKALSPRSIAEIREQLVQMDDDNSPGNGNGNG